MVDHPNYIKNSIIWCIYYTPEILQSVSVGFGSATCLLATDRNSSPRRSAHYGQQPTKDVTAVENDLQECGGALLRRSCVRSERARTSSAVPRFSLLLSSQINRNEIRAVSESWRNEISVYRQCLCSLFLFSKTCTMDYTCRCFNIFQPVLCPSESQRLLLEASIGCQRAMFYYNIFLLRVV